MENLVKQAASKLPEEISLVGMIQSRYSEINQLINEFKSKSPKLVSQRLPIHMRRRAASHNPNRLPSRVRKHVLKKQKERETATCSSSVSEAKEKKRKKHKKHQNSTKLWFSQAAREFKPDRSLLHIWFAKRFKMIKVFDQLLPYNNTTKNQRSLHRMSKQGCIHFHCSHLKCLQIRYDNIDQLTEVFAKENIDLKEFLQNDSQSSEVRSKRIYVTPHQLETSEMIGPVHLILIPEYRIILLWAHHLLLSELEKRFWETGITIEKADRLYQAFQLYGTESLAHLKKIMKDCGSFLPEKFQDGCITSIANWKFQPDSKLTTRESGSMEVDLNVNESNKLTNNFFIAEMRQLGLRQCITLIVPCLEAKEFWYNLVRNRSHLVGGLRDLQTIACESRAHLFLSTGHYDHPKRYSLIYGFYEENRTPNPILLRDSFWINTLKDPYLTMERVESLFSSHPHLKPALLSVELVCINRGVPTIGDMVFAPHEKDILNYVNRSKLDLRLEGEGYGPTKVGKRPQIMSQDHQLIGYVEYGHYSLDHGVGKGIAVITLESLIDLIAFKQDEKLYALIRSLKTVQYRIVQVIIDEFTIM